MFLGWCLCLNKVVRGFGTSSELASELLSRDTMAVDADSSVHVSLQSSLRRIRGKGERRKVLRYVRESQLVRSHHRDGHPRQPRFRLEVTLVGPHPILLRLLPCRDPWRLNHMSNPRLVEGRRDERKGNECAFDREVSIERDRRGIEHFEEQQWYHVSHPRNEASPL